MAHDPALPGDNSISPRIKLVSGKRGGSGEAKKSSRANPGQPIDTGERAAGT